MSVLKAYQKYTAAYYIEAAERIYLVCVKLVARMNNRYFIILGQPLINTASKLKENCKIANNLRTDDIKEIPERRKILHTCQGYLEELICQLSTIETLSIDIGHDIFLTAKNSTMSKSKSVEYVSKRLEEMLDDIAMLNKSLKSLIVSLDKNEVKIMQAK